MTPLEWVRRRMLPETGIRRGRSGGRHETEFAAQARNAVDFDPSADGDGRVLGDGKSETGPRQ
jgi:hypothetical protein